MKIFAIFSITNWEQIMLRHLKEIGETKHFSWTEGKYFFDSREEWQVFHDKLNNDLLAAFNDFYDETANMLVYIYTSDFVISERTMELIKRPNTLILSFCWDDLLYFKGSVKDQPVGIDRLSRHADINLTLSPEAIPRYLYHGSPCFFWKSLPVPVNEPVVLADIDETFYVLFIGSQYGWREPFVKRLRSEGIHVHCYGEGWENGSLPEEDMWKAIQRAPVTLGFSNVGYTKNVTTIKGRDFEVPLHGGLYLTQFSEGLSYYYDLGEEIYAYKDVEACIQQIAAIRANPIKASQVRKNGLVKALSVATWSSRFAYLQKLVAEITAV